VVAILTVICVVGFCAATSAIYERIYPPPRGSGFALYDI
jgi:hypothetical protein